MKNYLIRIVYPSDEIVGMPYKLTLDYYNQDGSKFYANADDLTKDLLETIPDANAAGVESVLDTLDKTGFCNFQRSLTEEQARHFGRR